MVREPRREIRLRTSAAKPSSGRWPTPCAAGWMPPSTSTSCSGLSSLSTSPIPSRSTAGGSRKSRTPTPKSGRVPRAEHLLGAARGALAAPQSAGQAPTWPTRGRCHGRHRTRQSGLEGRAAQGLRPPGTGQNAVGRLVNAMNTNYRRWYEN